jgi:serine/threonine protein kinase
MLWSVFPTVQRFLDQAILEYEVASRFSHPVLRKSLKLIRQRKLIVTTEVYVLMEMVDGLTLEQHRPGDPLQLCRLCMQVADGLDHMHKAGFVHADIKPNNILVSGNEQVKVIDFGQSCRTGTIKARIQGTPDYIAPEQVLRREITPQTDVFNLGATMYWLLTNQHVPTLIPRGVPGMILRDDGCPAPRDVDPKVSPALSSLVMNCLQTEPKDRPNGMDEVRQRLEIAAQQIERNGNGNGKSAPQAAR